MTLRPPGKGIRRQTSRESLRLRSENRGARCLERFLHCVGPCTDVHANYFIDPPISSDNGVVATMEIYPNLLVRMASIVITLIGVAFALHSKLSTIEENTKHTKKIEEVVTRPDERSQPFYFS